MTVTVSSGTASASDFTPVSAFTLTIDEGQSSGSAMFTLTPTDDDVDEVDETVTVEGSTAAAGLNVTATTVTITDDDERGVQVSPTTLTVPEGGDGTYTVILTSRPTGRVTVTPSHGSGDTDVTVSGALTFTRANWNEAQTVTVSAGSDADAENDTATIGHTIARADYGVNSVTADDVTVTVADVDTASTQVTLTVNPTAVGEGASTTTVTVTGTLNNAARTEGTAVTVTVSSGTASASDFAPVSAFTLTIDANQFSGTAMFTLAPTDDDVDEVDETLTVAGSTAAAGLNVTATTVTITDDDERGVQVSPTTLTVPEGGDGTYTVVLTSEPTGDVTVTPSPGSGDTDVTVSGALTFTTADWNVAQTATVSAGSDADAAHDTATIEHTIAGADYGPNGVTADDVTVTVADGDTASTRVTLTVNPAAVGEGASATAVTVTGTLDNAVRTEGTAVTVTVSSGTASASDFAPVSAFTLTIDEGLASGTAMFTLMPTDDDVDEVDETLTVGGSTAVAGLDVTETTVTINDDDERGVQVSATTLTVPEGGDGTYTVVLTSEPTGDVTVTPSRSGSSHVTVSPSPLTFTTADWNVAQTVTVSAGSDADAEHDTATIEHTIAGADYGANGVTAADVTVMVTDGDTASTQVTLTVDPTAVGEGDGATTVTVTGTLDHAVRTEGTAVTVTVSAGTASTSDFTPVSAFTLTIDASQSSGTAMFTLTPTDDDVDEVDETLTVAGSAAAAGLNVTATTVTITDDDERGVQVSATLLTVREGVNGTYTVVLTSQPTGPVTVTPSVTGSPDVTVSPSPLTFTAANWDDAQTVTVSAGSDADAENDTATIEHTIVGADYGANGVTAAGVTVTVSDDEQASTKVNLTVSTPTVAEDAGATQVTVTGALNGIPLAAATVVTVSVGASGDPATEGTDYAEVSDLTLTIPEGQTSATVDFTLTPANDDIDEADEALTISGTVQGLTVTDAEVTITDNDTRGVDVSPTTLVVAEGGNDTYTVVLSSEPTGPVTVTPSVTGSADVTVSPSPVTFTAGSWDTAQTMTVSAVHDADADADTATIEHAVSGADYGSEDTDDVAVTVTEDDTQSSNVTLTVSAPTVAEDAGATQVTVTAELDEAPQASATVVTVSVGAPGDGATEGTDYDNVGILTLAIPAGQTSATADFTLTVVNDDVDEENEALTVGGAVTVQHLTVMPSTVTITDDDTRGLAFSVSPLSVPEGGSSTYTVALSSRPTATVTVAITGVIGTDLTLDDTSLTFTSSNWDQPQTVTVSSVDDADTLDDQEALTHTATSAPSGDYQSLSAALPVNVVDDDVVMIVTNGVLVPSSPLNNRFYRLGETIRISVTFDQAVVVDTGGGVPVIKVPFTSLPNNRVVKDFEYASGSGSTTLMFEYQVQSADRDDDGIDIDNNALELNGGTIKDAWGRNVALSYTGSGELVDQQVDGSQTPNPARLTALSLTGITLDPAFNESTTSYSANVGYDVFMTRVRTTPENNGTVTIMPADADANELGHQVALETGVNEITITVRRDGRPDGTYTVTVTRASTTVSIAAGAPSATYRLEDVEFTVTRAETAGEPLEVGLTITQDQDFLAGTERSPRVTILANATSATHTLATSDFLGEVSADGRLTATVDAGDGYDVGSPASAGVDLLVANPAVTLRLEESSYAFLEDAGTVTLNVVAETAPRVPVPANLSLTVLVRDRPGTATGGDDYTFQTRILPIVASDFAQSGSRYVATKSYSFTVLDDSATEGEESFRIELSGSGLPPAVVVTRADGAPCVGPCYSEVVIVDDESPPAQVSGVRLEPGRGALTVDWNAVAGATGYKVQWKSGAETFADAATDSREAIISSGSTTRYSIPGLTDGTVYTVRVIATRTGAPGDGAASDEVTGKPGVPTLTIADAKATEGNAVEFTVTLDPASASDVTVAYATTDGTATAASADPDGADYTAPESGAQLTISANQTSGTITIATGDDTVDEDDETFTLTLSNPSSNAELGVQKTATGTIEDDDTDPAAITNIGFTNVPSSREYGLGDVIEVSVTFDAAVDVTGTPRIALQLPGAPAADRYVLYALYDDSAGSDTTLVFRKTVTAAVDDMDGMGVDADALDLNGGGIVNTDTTVAAVLDHDALSGGNIRTRIISGMAITSAPEVVAPAGYYGPGEEVEFTVTFAGPVTVETSSGIPALKFIASDIARQEAAYASGSGGTALVFTWTVPADVPGDEVPIEIPSNVGAGGALLTNGGLVLDGGTIRDSSARDVNIRHGQSATGSAVDTTGPALVAGAEGATVAGTELVLTFERAAGEAEHLDGDSVPAAGDFAVWVQSTVQTVSDVAVADVAVAGATVTLTLSEPVGHAQTVTVGYTPGTDALEDVWGNNAPGFSARSVRNDSPESELSIDDVVVDEGDGTAEFTVTLDLASGETVTVDYATADGTALAGSDYTAASGTLTFAAGDTSKTIVVLVTDDSLGEGDEDFTVTLSSASNAGMSNGEATGTITDNEIPTLTIADATATEGASVSFTVTLDPASSSDVTVAYATSDGTATADSADADGADYTAPASGAELIISAGRTSETISIATGDDTVDEDDETFTLTLSNPSSNAELGVQKTATGTIEDDDTDPAQVTNVAFTNEPSDSVYGLGDVIEVSVTFDAAVDVTGTPRIALQLPGTPAADRYALYDDSASSDTELVFRKTVTAAVDDMDGMGVGANALELNGGGIVNKDTTVAAVLDHDALSGGNIRTRIISGMEITSVPEVVAPAGYYGPGEEVEFRVTFAGLVTVDTSSGTPALLFIASDGARQEAAYASGSGFTQLEFTWTVPADVPGDEVPIEIPSNVGTGGALLTDRGLVLDGGTIRDLRGRDVNIRHGPYATGSAADTTGPALVAGAEGATVAGTELVLTFERGAGEAEHLDEDSVPAAGDFAVRVQSTVHTVSDVAVDGATVTLTLSDPVGHAQTVTVGYTPGTGALEDVWGNNAPGFSARSVRNDSPEPELSIEDVTVDEGDGAAEFTVTLDLASGETVTVVYATADGTALAGSDYTAASGTLTFAAGDTSKTIDVLVTDDSLGEGDEDFTVTLSSAANAGMSNGEATGTITDNEIPTLTIADATATEGASVSFTVTLDPESSSDVTVAYATSDGTATADSADADGADYTAPASGAELIISAGRTSETISIATGDDTVDEDDETFTLTLSNPSSNAELGVQKTATGTIEDDDTDPAQVTNVAFTNEPSDSVYGLGDVIEVSVTFDAAVDVTGTPRIALQLLGTPAADRYALYDDSASSDTELVFRMTVTAAVDDMDGMGVGANALEKNGGGIVNKDTTVAAVLDHDALSGGNIRTRIISGMEITSVPEVVAPAGYYGPGEEVEFRVTFAGLVTVDTSSGTPALLFIASDGARQEAAYASGSGFTQLEFTWTVPADVPGDEVPIEIPSNVGTGGALLTDRGLVLDGGTIRDLRGRDVNIRHGPYATGSAADTTGPALVAGAEGATVAGTELVLTFERAAGDAEHLDEDSVPAAGDFAVRVQSTVHTVSDVAVDGATVTLTLSDPVGHAQTVTVGYTPGTDALEDVWGNNAPGFSARSVRNDSPEPELSIEDVTVDEGDGTAEFTVTLDLASGETVTVDYATADGTALAGSDYTAASGTLTFAAGDTSKTIVVLVTDDSLGEGDEDFTVTLSSASNAGMSNGEATGTITDNEIPTLTIADATATEGASVSFTVTLDPESSSDVTVAYATSDGTATADSADADGADYTAPASGAELTISAGGTSGTITIATGEDIVYEEDETFTVTLSSPSTNAVLGTSKTATGTIENDDSPSTDAALKALTMTAGGSGVTLSPTFVAESYSYRADVANTVSSVSVGAEANHRKATVAIIGGTDLAFAENTLTVRVTAEDGATTQDYTVIVTRALPELAWEGQSTLSLEEDIGAVDLTVTLTPASSDQVTVDYVTSGDTAGEDYTHASGTLTFAPGETRKTTTVTILDDTLYEPGSVDVVLVVLSNATGTAVLGAATIYLQIQDNESPPTATMEDVTVDEGDGTMVFTLSLAHGISRGIEYRTDYGGLGGTATEWVDYDPIFSESGVVNLRIPARQTSATFAVTILDDDVHEADETISIRWSRISPDVATESIDVTGTITNDDERGVQVSDTTLTVREGGDGTYTVVLTSQPTGPVTVTPLHGSGDTDVTVSGALTFTTADWNVAQTVTVSAASDTDAENDTATIEHTIAGADYGANSVTADDVTVTVTDDDTASTQVTLTVDPTAVGEGDSATTVTVTGTLDHAVRTEGTEVTVTVSSGTASASDFAPVSAFTLTIDANQPFGTAVFTLTPTDDDVDEVDETLTVAGGTAVAGLNVTATTVTINDDDERGVQVSPTTLTVPEGGDGTYTVVLTSQPTGPVTVTPCTVRAIRT